MSHPHLAAGGCQCLLGNHEAEEIEGTKGKDLHWCKLGKQVITLANLGPERYDFDGVKQVRALASSPWA